MYATKSAATLVAVLVLSVVLAACGGAQTGGASTKTLKQVGEGEGQVDIIAWAGYIERGEADPNYDWVTQFEKDTGCKVNVKVAGSSDEMVTLMNQGGFDLVTASGDASLRLILGGKIQQFNPDLVPSWNTVDPRLQSAPWNTVNGKHYGVPYQWGANVLMYNTEAFGGTAPQSWEPVFSEMNLADGKSNQGRVQAYYGPIYIADGALYLMAHQPELGIKDPYELTEEQFKAVVELLKGQRKLVGRYWSDAITQTDDFKNEGVVVSTSWPFQVNMLKAEGQPIDSVIPSEGATGWADTTLMHVDAPHPNCAYKWMEWSLNPKVQGDVVHAFVWQGGKMIDLGTLGRTHSYELDINEHGEMVGATGDPHEVRHRAVLWTYKP